MYGTIRVRRAEVGDKGTEKDVPSIEKLIYPAELPTFEELANGGHNDIRAVAYTIYCLDEERTRPFTHEELHGLDFGGEKETYRILLEKGLIQKLGAAEELEAVFTIKQIEELLSKRGLKKSGRKRELAARLVNDGYKLDRRTYRSKWFKLTDIGKKAILEHRADAQTARRCAILSIKQKDYRGAVLAYRAFDGKWGFVHTSGKRHTIFANYDISERRFMFLRGYPMRELKNSREFKETLRACMIAGLMRGMDDQWGIKSDVESICSEAINCPKLLKLFDYEKPVIDVMRREIEFDIGHALAYYISHIEYLSRMLSR